MKQYELTKREALEKLEQYYITINHLGNNTHQNYCLMGRQLVENFPQIGDYIFIPLKIDNRQIRVKVKFIFDWVQAWVYPKTQFFATAKVDKQDYEQKTK